jgi:hypothetical protein
MKGIIITAANQNKIAVQYAMELADVDDLLPIDWVFLADFGSDTFAGVLTQTNFNLLYNKGQALENEYFVVEVK